MQAVTNGLLQINAISGSISPESITALSSLFTAIFSSVAMVSVLLLRKQIKSDHDRSRRERALDLMLCYSTTQDPTNHEIVHGLALLHNLSKEQCQALWARESFEVTAPQQALLSHYRAAINSSKGRNRRNNGASANNDASKVVNPFEVATLRSIATVTLNKLEMVASAWFNNVADREIIETEFIKVFCPRDGIYVLDNFRSASGVYPSIKKLCGHYENKKLDKNPGKEPTG